MSSLAKTLRVLGTAAGAAVLTAAGAIAQDVTYGKTMFQDNCAVCHGQEGAGDGPVSDLFSQRPSNLRMLAKSNDGKFPFAAVYESIDGRRDITAHGLSQMPIWGDLFREDAYPSTIHPGVRAEDIVQGRILGLVYFLQTIQEE